MEWHVGSVESFLLPVFIRPNKIAFQVIDPGNLADIGTAAFARLIDVRLQPDAKLFASQAEVRPAAEESLA